MTAFATLPSGNLGRDAFVAAFGDIYEHSPWVAADTWDRLQGQGLSSIEAVHAAMSDTLPTARDSWR